MELDTGMPATWTAVVPARSADAAKSRLERAERAVLATAFLDDVLAALAGSRAIARTVVVTADPSLADRARAIGAEALADPGEGLGAALLAGIAAAGGDALVVLGDLPCLDAAAVDAVAALAGATGGAASFVPDAAGTGTTMLALPAGSGVQPAFGPRSRARHAAAGAVELHVPGIAGARARRDVDTEVDLWDAVRIGVGPATRAAVAPAIVVTLLDEDGGDDGVLRAVDGAGTLVRVPWSAVRGLRSVRRGQRLLATVEDGTATRARLP